MYNACRFSKTIYSTPAFYVNNNITDEPFLIHYLGNPSFIQTGRSVIVFTDKLNQEV